MTQNELNALILSGGFPALLLDINSVQKKYRAKLDMAIQQRERVEADFKTGYYTVEWKNQEYGRIIDQIRAIEQEAAAQLEQAKQAFISAVDNFHKPDGSQLTGDLLNLLQSGLLSDQEYLQLAADNVGKPTAYRAIAQAANKGGKCLVPDYQRGDQEKKILRSYLDSTRGLTHDDQDYQFLNAWSEEILKKAIEQLNALTVRPQTQPATLDEMRAKAAKEAQEKDAAQKKPDDYPVFHQELHDLLESDRKEKRN